MSRHRFDPLSFVFGLVFATVAVAGLTGPWTIRPIDLAWAGPALLILLGVVVLASGGTRREARRPAREDGPATGPQHRVAAEDGSTAGEPDPDLP
jgi:hypothetical protein